MLNNLSAIGAGSAAGATPATQNEAASADRFLKLLVAQMKNQDPMNPMDNAQITSQMAQINTVAGIEKLNGSVGGLNSQLVQLRAVQGASLVGHEVTIAGDRLSMAGDLGSAGFELAGPADRVTVEVMNASGRVVDTLQLGAQGGGIQAFEWQRPATLDAAAEYRFRVTARSGSATVDSTPLMRDRVNSVSTSGDTLKLDLARSGVVPYGSVKAFG